MAKSRSRGPSDFQVQSDVRDAYTEALAERKTDSDSSFRQPGSQISLRKALLLVVGLTLPSVAFGAFGFLLYGRAVNELVQYIKDQTVDHQLVWGPNGTPRPDGMVWVAKCPNNSRPITGTCVVLEGHVSNSSVPLQNFGVNPDNNQWECAWTQRVLAANVRPLCPR
jgi:hypothetical protein